MVSSEELPHVTGGHKGQSCKSALRAAWWRAVSKLGRRLLHIQVPRGQPRPRPLPQRPPAPGPRAPVPLGHTSISSSLARDLHGLRCPRLSPVPLSAWQWLTCAARSQPALVHGLL